MWIFSIMRITSRRRYDADGHWTECACGQSTAKEDHVYDDDRDSTCNVCGYVRVPPVTGVADTVFFVVIALTALCGIAVTVVVAKKRKEENSSIRLSRVLYK